VLFDSGGSRQFGLNHSGGGGELKDGGGGGRVLVSVIVIELRQ
jgi:hypothetical protein